MEREVFMPLAGHLPGGMFGLGIAVTALDQASRKLSSSGTSNLVSSE